MTALADELARLNNLHPVSDDVMNHVAASGWSVDRVAQALLDEPMAIVAEQRDVVAGIAYLAINSVIPTDLDQVPVDKIIELRESDGGDELRRFQSAVADVAASFESIETITNERLFDAHLTEAFEATLRPELDRLHRRFSEMNVDTIFSAIDIKVAAPAVLAATLAGGIAPAVVVAGGAVAYSAARLLRGHRRQVTDAAEGSNVAFLLRIERELKPLNLAQRVAQMLQRFI